MKQPNHNEIIGSHILITGIVQGVGFRPYIYQLANQYHLTGWVRNTSRGVEIIVNGLPGGITAFQDDLPRRSPELSRIDSIEISPCPPDSFFKFEILPSTAQMGDFLPISPDIAICEDCRRELFNPADRRYRYPFINCTNCGPRFTIVKDIPYDRTLTTMAQFPMCPQCQAEYDNPMDRRFHAQPTACPVCGPHVYLRMPGKADILGEDAIQRTKTLLQQGKIVAIKGLGGYHLACDATNHATVTELRRRKKRSGKPFALMASDINTIKKYCYVNSLEEDLLYSRQSPIVLLDRIQSEQQISPEVAPGQTTLGFMLPYTPLHLLLLEPTKGIADVLVMTSGNLSEEPIAFLDDEAENRLESIADAFLIHNRPIHMRTDDSVFRIIADQFFPIRRSRGYAPDPLSLPFEMQSILAVGAQLKNTFCLTRDKYAFISHFIGDLENYETLQSFETGISHYENLFKINPRALACDLHPDYLSSQYADARAKKELLPLLKIQHHHAHLAACLAENGWNDNTSSVIGLIYDGTGLGTDGAIWGGEIFIGNLSEYHRAYHLAYLPMPGGDIAVLKPARLALGYLHHYGIDWISDLPPVKHLCSEERMVIRNQIEHQINTPQTSSMGRLFDAVSALIGVCQQISYEGQAAIELESSIDPAETNWYPFHIDENIVDPKPLIEGIIDDWLAGVSTAKLAARFHRSIVEMNIQVCKNLREITGLSIVALSGGVWQNKYLMENTTSRLIDDGFSVITHHKLPANDGCIALGQAIIANSQINLQQGK